MPSFIGGTVINTATVTASVTEGWVNVGNDWVRMARAYSHQTATVGTAPYLWPGSNAGTATGTATGTAWITWERQRRATDRTIAEYDAAWDQIEQERRQREALRRARASNAVPIRRHTEDAKQRAQALLLDHLTPAQRETFTQHEWFVVEGGQSKTKYRIRAAGALVANIDVLYSSAGVKERVTHRLCGHCDPKAMPLGDHLLAQKMMLELAEDDFLRIANRHAA